MMFFMISYNTIVGGRIMDKMRDKEVTFMNLFSNSDIVVDGLPSKKELPIHSRFLTNEIGTEYIGNMLKNIDIRLYIAYLKLLKDKIEFIENYDVKKSVCVSEVSLGVISDVNSYVPYIHNGMDILAISHELGHMLKAFTQMNNERYLHSNTVYDETISILFGRICLERYINDFGFDIYVQQFESLNIQNAVYCLEEIKKQLPKYLKKQDALDRAIEIFENKKHDYKYHLFVQEVEQLRDELYQLISYPIGISLANVYDNFDRLQKEKYLELVSKYLLNIRHIDFEMILEYFDIPFDANFYIENFKEYIETFKKQNDKIFVLGGTK